MLRYGANVLALVLATIDPAPTGGLPSIRMRKDSRGS
jgi:hypothetical protein